MSELKLNNKRTILVGLAFLSICSFWQMYDNLVPLILKNTFHMDESLTGAIMAADNILALFLLPLFGGLSDRTDTKLGRRTPYILAGTAGAVVLMNLLPMLDNSYFRQAAPFKLVSFVIVLGLLLIAMGTYRSPAVALMPDVTPKPLRSKGNAIINLMGAVGGVLYLGISVLLYPREKTQGLVHVDYQPLFFVVSLIMVVAVAVLLLTIREPKLARENRALEKKHPEWNLAKDDGSGGEVLPGPVKKSLIFLLASIALWYVGYNGVTTWFSTYVSQVMGEGIGGTNTCLMVATVGAIVSYIPIGAAASRFGRKRTIQAGVILLAACFGAGFLLTRSAHTITAPMYAVFALVGLAWAAINVNSLPMVVEMCKGSDVGRFTGYYYTASMTAQVVTPVLAGTLMKRIGYQILFPYAAFFVAMSFVTMLFVRHGDSKAEARTGLDAFEDMDDQGR
ncbi:MAG: SLC45 family MFS transporter [Oscillospiraceae bacterium]|nr:SLC45 family MFS transporter [Oscillospiraceae bacterium]MCI9308275.1 SLC45 family MFS transporter [Oscillospiraceae bacterium]MCI9547708.1 SLC45 family MFS transporter [Oscillospiraceae bacterium]